MAREGAHSLGRILRAGGDATGQEIESALLRRARDLGIVIHEDTDANRLLLDARGRCTGVEAAGPQGELVIRARGTILATGGAGQVFSHTSNPSVSSGDGMAMAWQAGAELMDMEFFQFHPTALAMPGNPRLLITEAVRGEGALLLDQDGRRFMSDYHPQAELAPRDVVARAILHEAWRAGKDHVWLDARNLKDGTLRASDRFPTVYRRILEHGLDMERELIPVSPVAHYAMGGVRTDTWGRTTLPGLWACGETACLGTHGANRLASNSLLESLVFAGRSALSARDWDGRDWHTDLLPVGSDPTLRLALPVAMLGAAAGSPAPGSAGSAPVENDVVERVTERIRSLMWRQFGLVRDPVAMQRGLAELLESRGGQETLWTVAVLVGQAALFRRESRGAHNRTDYAGPDPAWQAHTVLWRDGSTLRCGLAPLANVVEVA
jgi:L-aspartate oxidase